MSAEAIHGHGEHEETDPHAHYAHQFMDREQSNECYIVGMWSFLVTEVMFFGALFIAYTVYRYTYPADFAEISRNHLDAKLGFLNTLLLLTSSLTMALAVRAAQLKNKAQLLFFMGVTILFAFGFLGIKTIEYGAKYEHHLFPGPYFHYEDHAPHGATTLPKEMVERAPEVAAGVPVAVEQGRERADRAQIFFSLYFIMTGLHGVHVIIGILIMGVMWFMIHFDHPHSKDFIPVEMAGLYWHFVDIVWIFLYPLLYLIHPDLERFLKF